MFKITRVFYNGYRCDCCSREWEGDVEFFETLGEALAQVPRKIPEEKEGVSLKNIQVKSAHGDECFAYASLRWPPGYYRSAPYEALEWSGWLDLGEGEGLIKICDTQGPKDTWVEILAWVREKDRTQRLRKAERAKEEAERQIEILKGEAL